MPAYTRSSARAPVARTLDFSAAVRTAVHYNMAGERWTQQEERDMIRLLRHENRSVAEVATMLHRSPLAVHYRIDKVLMDHIGEDEVGVLEASKWLHPHISARQMSEDFKAHIAAFRA